MSVRDDLKAYLDGELPPLRMAEVRDAVDRDPDLARELSELEALSVAVKSATVQPAAVGLDDTLAALGRQKRRAVFPGWPLALAGAAALAAIALPILLTKGGESDASDLRSVAFKSSAKSSTLNGVISETKAEAERQPQSAADESQVNVAGVAAPPAAGASTAAKLLAPSADRPAEARTKSALQTRKGEVGYERLKSDVRLRTAAKLPAERPAGKPAAPALLRQVPLEPPPVFSPANPRRQSDSVVAQETGPIVVEVASVEDAQVKLEAIASRFNGSIERIGDKLEVGNNYAGKASDGRVVLNVPAVQAEQVIQAVRDVAKKDASSVSITMADSVSSNQNIAGKRRDEKAGDSNFRSQADRDGRVGGFGGGAGVGRGFGNNSAQGGAGAQSVNNSGVSNQGAGTMGRTGGSGSSGGGFTKAPATLAAPPAPVIVGGSVNRERNVRKPTEAPLRRRIVIVIRKKAPEAKPASPPPGNL